MNFDRQKSFGYPTLRTFLEGDDPQLMDYPNKTFDPDISIKIDVACPDTLLLEYEVGSLRISALDALVVKKQASFHFKVECKSTFYCESFSSFENEDSFQIPASNLKDKIEITPFLVADETILLSSDAFHEDFLAEKFEVNRGSVLAIGRPTEYFISREQFRAVRSIFDFNKSDEVEEGAFQIRTDEQYVVIEVHPSIFEKVKRAEQDVVSQKLILNSLYVPVVMQLLYEIKQDPGLAETKRWANTIVAKCTQKSLDYNDDGAVAQNAQKLLAMPFGLLANSNFRSAR